jgi:heat shock protein HslJ
MIPWTVFVLAVAAAASAGCAAPSRSSSPTAPSSTAAALLGPTWAAFEIDGQAVDAREPGRQPNIVLAADGNRVSGTTGCNRIAGSFTHQGATLRFGTLAMTRVACVPDRSAIEQAFVAALEATTSQAIANETLELRDAAGSVRMRLRAG